MHNLPECEEEVKLQGGRARIKLNDQDQIKIKEINQARSRLYRSQILQENTRWKALAEIYTMHSFAPFSNLNFSLKIAEIFAEFLQTVANLILPEFF